MEIAGYEITEQLYETERSRVYKGMARSTSHSFILKTSLPGEMQKASETAIRNEYEITSALEGPMKPIVLQKTETGLVLIRSYIEGETLSEWNNKNHQTLAEKLRVSCLICAELEKIHFRQLIHKEINPNNIIITAGGQSVHIIDYGLSSKLELKCNYLGNPRKLEGTPEYISPEQTGRMNRVVDYRCDLYSLGITLHELFSGELPFNSASPYELIYAHIAKSPDHISDKAPGIPRMIGDIIQKLLAKNAENRYQSATRLKNDLENCKQQWNENQTIVPFDISGTEVSMHFKIPQKLYGREKDRKQLLDAFANVTKGRKMMVLVSGYTGIGKSAIVYDVHVPVTTNRGFFTSGKFEELQRDIPYLAWTQAFNRFIDLVLSEEKPVIQKWAETLQQALGEMASVVTSLIPHLERIIGKQPPPAPLPVQEMQNRFNYALRLFVGAICTKEHPLVIFIDDFQWADAASLNLLRTILTEPGLGHLLIIGAYRENEVNEAHAFVTGIKELEKDWQKVNETDTTVAYSPENTLIERILLNNLDLQSIQQLVCDTLFITEAKAEPLAVLIMQKTLGNSFFVHRFLEALFEAGHFQLKIIEGSPQWVFNINELQKLNITDNVIDLLSKKIEKLGTDTKDVLFKASCIGHQFDLETLYEISDRPPSEIMNALNEIIREGFIAPVTPDFRIFSATASDSGDSDSLFRFSHDRVRQAVYSFINAEERKSIHRRLGLLMLKESEGVIAEEKIFEIASHLNEGGYEEKDPQLVSHVNLKAGLKAKHSSAYGSAYNFFKIAVSAMPQNSWKDDYSLTLNLYNQTGETAYLSGNYDEMEKWLDIILTNASTPLDKLQALEIRTNSLFVRQRFIESIESGLNALRTLGLNLPTHPGPLSVVKELIRIRIFMRDRKAEDLINLPLMTDEVQKAIVRILANMAPPVFFSEPNLFPIIIFRMTEISVKYGIAPASSYAFGVYGFVLCGIIGDVNKGTSFGKLAMDLLRKYDFKEYRARTLFSVHFFIDHWKRHSSESLSSLKDAYRQSLESGEADFTAFLGNAYSQTAILNAVELEEISKELNNQYIYADQTKHFISATFNKIYHQYVQCLQNKTKNPAILKGSLYDAPAMHDELFRTKNKSTLFNQNYYQAQLSLFFGNYEEAVHACDIAAENYKTVVSVVIAKHFLLVDFLSRYHFALQSPRHQAKHRSKMSADIKGLQKYARFCPEEFDAKLKLADACLANLKKDVSKALALFSEADKATLQQSYNYDRGLVLLEYYRFCVQNEFKDLAAVNLQKAINWFDYWGAGAVAEKLKTFIEKDKAPLFSIGTNRTTKTKISTSRLPSGGDIDFYSILKGLQVISSELEFHQLNSKMLEIMVENACAERGIIVLERQNQFFVETEFYKDGTVRDLKSIPLRQYGMACQPVINYVLNTLESVVLDNATAEGRFVNDVYIREHHVKSLLCIPIRHVEKLTGLVYLENNIAEGAFTESRTEVLKILGAQASISIENAKYYNDIQELNKSYERFVPKLFLAELEKKSIVDIELGNQVTKNMGVLFTDIRNYTSISEKITAAAAFSLLNEIWGALTPVIDQNRGIVDKYIGDSIMALFPVAAEDALKAAVQLQQKLNDLNAERIRTGQILIQIGVGINFGTLILGTVGSSNRLNTTVIGDTVNITSRLESLTKILRTGILLTEEVANQVQTPGLFNLRNIGLYDLKGKSTAITLYEEYSNNPEALLQLKRTHQPLFDEFILKLRYDETENARSLLQHYIHLVPDDTIALYYCEKLGIKWASPVTIL